MPLVIVPLIIKSEDRRPMTDACGIQVFTENPIIIISIKT